MQNPRRFLHVGHRVTCDAWSRCRYARQNSPSKPKNTTFGVFSARWANFFALTHTPSQAGRKTSRTGRSDVATLKPTTPLQPLIRANVKPPSPMLAPKQQPLKPPSPLQPKTTPKTPISHPQRRRRFQSHAGASEQRRRRFQTTGPPRLQHPNAAPVGGGAWLRCPAGSNDTTAPTFRT